MAAALSIGRAAGEHPVRLDGWQIKPHLAVLLYSEAISVNAGNEGLRCSNRLADRNTGSLPSGREN